MRGEAAATRSGKPLGCLSGDACRASLWCCLYLLQLNITNIQATEALVYLQMHLNMHLCGLVAGHASGDYSRLDGALLGVIKSLCVLCMSSDSDQAKAIVR